LIRPDASARRGACAIALRRLTTSFDALWAVVGIGIALALPALGYWALDRAAGLLQGGGARPQITIFLAVATERSATQAVEARLRALAAVADTRLLAREDTLARMKTSGGLAEAIAVLPDNPFPDAIAIRPADAAPAALEALAAQLRQWPEVEHVQFDADAARRLAALGRATEAGVLLLAVLFGSAALAMLCNALRLQAQAWRADIGAGRIPAVADRVIRRAFLWHGALLGLAGGLLAWLIVAAAIYWLRLPVAELAGLHGILLQIDPPGGAQALYLLGAATLLGGLGAALSLGPLLRRMP
jgi:cell division transport system permease protein